MILVSSFFECYARGDGKGSDSITDCWIEVPATSDFVDEMVNNLYSKPEYHSYLSKSYVKLFKHRCSNNKVQFYCYRGPIPKSHDSYKIYIKVGNKGVYVSTFEEMTDYVFSTFSINEASSALEVIKSYAVHHDIYNYFDSETLRHYEEEDFNAILSLYSGHENNFAIFEYNLCDPTKCMDWLLEDSAYSIQPWIEKWQIFAYKQTCECCIGSLYTNENLDVKLLGSKVGDKVAYALAFISSKPSIFELNNSQCFIKVCNKKTGKVKKIENMTYLAILMEIIDSSLIPNDQEKIKLIQKIRELREIMKVGGKYDLTISGCNL